ncbi:MAG: DHA2 family efflux MFS transporter permease subunit [Peptococcaceae bacterium]|nr:DHA2 family efflux MFS transporter permease subunit [Peptococcaceae bacterium]
MSTYSQKNNGLLIGLIIIACFLSLFNSTAMNAGLPMFIKIFKASVTEVQWIMIGYTVMMGVVSPLASWFVHRFSLRRYFVCSMLAFSVLSLLSGIGTNIYLLIVVRALQGLAGASMVPVSMIAIYRYIPRHKQPLFITIQNMSLSLGPAIGPVIAGLLLVYVSWRWLFWLNVPLALLAMVLGMKALPKEDGLDGEDLDFLSMVSILIGSLLVLLAFSLASDRGLLSPMILSMIIGGVILCAFFIRRQGKLRVPVLSFKTLRYREFALSLIVNGLLSMALCLAPFVLAIYLQTVRGYSAFAYGLLLLVPAIFSIGGAPISQRLYSHLSSKVLIALGLVCLTVGNFLCGLAAVDTSIVFFIGVVCLRYLGIGIMGMPVTDHGMRALPSELQDDGSTLINWVKLMASSFSLSVFTMVYTMVSSDVAGAGSEVLAMVKGVDEVFVSSAVMLAAGLVVTAFLKNVNPREKLSK